MADPARRRSVILIVVASLLSSTGGFLVKSIPWPPLAIAGDRAIIAAVVLCCLCWRSLHFTFSWLQIATALAYAGSTILFAVATKLTTAANAILLQQTAPIWIALFGAAILGERATRRDWLFIAGMLIGLAIFLYDGLRFQEATGIWLAFASGVFFAAMIILMRKQKESAPVEPVILGNVLGFLIGLPATFSMHTLPSEQSMLAMLALGIGQLGLNYWLYTKAIRHVTALEGSLIPMIVPILNPLWVMLIIGERPTGGTLVGGIIVLSAVALRAAGSAGAMRTSHSTDRRG